MTAIQLGRRDSENQYLNKQGFVKKKKKTNCSFFLSRHPSCITVMLLDKQFSIMLQVINCP
jgi:hypothetical protein